MIFRGVGVFFFLVEKKWCHFLNRVNMCDSKNKPFLLWIAFSSHLCFRFCWWLPPFFKLGSPEEGREVLVSREPGLREWTALWGGPGSCLVFSPSWHICFTCSSSLGKVKLRFSGFTSGQGWCLLHHMDVSGKVLLMLVPRGIWDRAGHFKGTASLFW